MYKACSRCGKIHDSNYKCFVNRFVGGEERELRATYKWHKKAKEIKEKANYLCEVCRDKGIYTFEGLETHHIVSVKNEPGMLLDDLNLICLCTACHKKAEAGKLTKEYLEGLARAREGC